MLQEAQSRETELRNIIDKESSRNVLLEMKLKASSETLRMVQEVSDVIRKDKDGQMEKGRKKDEREIKIE